MENIPNNIEDYWFGIHADRKPADIHWGLFNAPASYEFDLVILGQVFEKQGIVEKQRTYPQR